MQLNKNGMMLKSTENENGIIETQKNSETNEWNIIGNKKIWNRNCPICKKLLNYNDYKNYWAANKKQQKCRACSKLGNIGRKGQSNTDEHKRKVGLKHKGRKISEISKMKMREAALNRIKKFKTKPYTNYNPKACEYFDDLNKHMGWNLQHALNGGEIQIIGYSLDAYDKEKNIVVEYDEPLHEKPSIKKKDLIRQNRIIERLNCKFYRYSEKYQELKLIENPQLSREEALQIAKNIKT